MRKAILICMVLAACTLAAPYLEAANRPVNVSLQPSYESQFYWDDGVMSSAWCWYTGGNYWAVQFDEEKTEGADRGMIEALGAAVHPYWPDSIYQGAYLHIIEDDGDYPGVSIFRELHVFENPGEFEWLSMEQHVYGSVFYVAFEQYGNYPDCDALGVDAVGGTHNWTGYQGSWGNTSTFSDFMLRCYWQPLSDVAETTWGQVKALY